MTGPSKKGLRRAALRLSRRNPVWLGYWLARHRRHEGMTQRQMAAALGTTTGGLVLLSLCRTPREGSFVDDLELVCRRTGANRFTLARMLRQEQALADWTAAPPGPRGWLAAASDAMPLDTCPPPPEPPDEFPAD